MVRNFLVFACILLLMISVVLPQSANEKMNRMSNGEEIEYLIDHARKVFYVSQDSALKVSRQAVRLARNSENKNLYGDVLYAMGYNFYRLSKTDSAIHYLRKSLNLRKALGDSAGIGESMNRLGNVYWYLGEQIKAKKYYESALEIQQKIDNYKEAGRILNNLANTYRRWNDYDTALDYYLKSLENYQKIDFTEGMAWLNFSLTLFYKKLNQNENALASLSKSFELYEKLANTTNDSTGLMLCYGQLGDIYHIQGKYEQGLSYHLKALKMRRRSGVESAIADGLSGVGQGYYHLGRYQEAIASFEQSMEIGRKINNLSMMSTNLKYLGYVYHKLGNVKQAIDYLQHGLKIAREQNSLITEKQILKKLSQIYAELDQFARAHYYQTKYIAALDSNFSSEVTNRLASMKILYDIKEKENENVRLSQDNRIKELELEKSKTTHRLLLIIITVTIAGVLLIIHFYTKKAKTNRQLTLKNNEIEAARILLENEIEERKQIESEREKLIADLQDSLKKIKTLGGLVPICSKCKSIRNDHGYYEKLEKYMMDHSEIVFSHGICPDCARELYPEFIKDEE